MAKLKLLIVIPAYNEAETIVSVVEELKKVVPQYDYVIVNDGSRDNTPAICRERNYNLLELPAKTGMVFPASTLARRPLRNSSTVSSSPAR